MAEFESGVKGYVIGEATVTVKFPIDWHGNEDVNCYQCYYFRRNYQTCGLNGEICQYPSKYIGASCPLKFKEEKTDESI
jgi:hypothetical protein